MPSDPISQTELTDDIVEQALEDCAAEPVHIPGIVQPFGALIGVNGGTGQIDYASENCAAILGLAAEDLLGGDFGALFGSEVRHALRNAQSSGDYGTKALPLGAFAIGGHEVEASAFGLGDAHVVQFEAARDAGLGGSDALTALSFLMAQVQACQDEAALFTLTTKLLAHFTGYDRVMIYKFDPQWNGEVVAETCHRTMEPYLGLRFPQWDIPAQARAIMAKLPLRFIQDVDQTPVPLQPARGDLPPLDITLATARGVSQVHMQYLRQMGVKATLTLSVTVEDRLWGIISLHHRRPRVPPAQQREVLVAFLGLFCTKLAALQKQAQLELLQKVDQVKDTLLKDIEDDGSMEDIMPRIGPVVLDILQSTGLAVLTGSQTVSHGQTPDQALLTTLLQDVQAQPGTPILSDNLARDYPAFAQTLNGCVGVYGLAINPNRALLIFRCEIAQSVSWAGNPEKDISVVSGQARLAPRGSFSTYLQEVQGCSAPWTDEDIYFADRIWVLINSAERRALKNTLNRQQTLMINELNHRVRNILALVRSVSRQARRHYGSLESYSVSLENRIQALAAAHDIASGSLVAAVNVAELIAVETDPFQTDGRITISGVQAFLRADIAPIFSLVIHELTTNAVKYGALSNATGKVEVAMAAAEGGLQVSWRETGGPSVTLPNNRGFGTTLIEQAVPHEMGGRAELRFDPGGLAADLHLPDAVLEAEPSGAPATARVRRPAALATADEAADIKSLGGAVLVHAAERFGPLDLGVHLEGALGAYRYVYTGHDAWMNGERWRGTVSGTAGTCAGAFRVTVMGGARFVSAVGLNWPVQPVSALQLQVAPQRTRWSLWTRLDYVLSGALVGPTEDSIARAESFLAVDGPYPGGRVGPLIASGGVSVSLRSLR